MEGSPGVYRVLPPEPAPGFWTGYYVEVFFKSDTGMAFDFEFSTPGYAWPNTLPFPDCSKETCLPILV